MTSPRFEICAVIPTLDHCDALPGIVDELRRRGLAVVIVDDGSGEGARGKIAALARDDGSVAVIRFERNRGKGAAVLAGFDHARARGFSHALQVDADGQHGLSALGDFLETAKREPDAVIAGHAVFDVSIPLGRRLGKWFTQLWIWLETLSFSVTDGMCGFRVYPLGAVELLRTRQGIAQRMDFDVDILVRLYWQGTPVVMRSVSVTYPPGNRSNFDYWRDNLRITRMHARLVFEMPRHVGAMLRARRKFERPGESDAWWGLGERGVSLGLGFLGLVLRLAGPVACRIVALPVVGYFFLTGGERRRASLDYLRRVFSALGAKRRPGLADSWRHHMAFFDMALDKFRAWTDPKGAPHLIVQDAASLEHLKASRQGALFFVSHHGNIDVSRASIQGSDLPSMTVLLHSKNAILFSRAVERLNPAFAANTVQVTEIGPDTAIALMERVERGEWIVMAADRVPVGPAGRIVEVPFLGDIAPFSQGPYILASILGCRVYLLFCSKGDGGYRLTVEAFAEKIVLPRASRERSIAAHAARYAARLERECLKRPFEWHNFFDFWSRHVKLPKEQSNRPSS